LIVDASVILSAFFPDENQHYAQALIRAHVSGHEPLLAPALLWYELTNAVLQAVRRQRITDEQSRVILEAFEGLDIETRPVGWREILALARQFDRSAYDAAYLALAQTTGQRLITGDRRLYNAVKDHLDKVCWIGDYVPPRPRPDQANR
jgi:predicted nucleic acid-binding protein